MTPGSADVLVVGAGVVGLSIALALRDRGAGVVVPERTDVADGHSGIQPGEVRLQWGTSYDVTPDRQPILGPVPGHDGLHVAAGFSDHGFMSPPQVARIVAGGVAGHHDRALAVLDLRRFDEGREVPEPQVI